MARNKDESGNCQGSPPVIENIIAGAEQEPPDDDALLGELAALGPIEYDRRRDAAAGELGIRVATLDRVVELRRPAKESGKGQGFWGIFELYRIYWEDMLADVGSANNLNDLA